MITIEDKFQTVRIRNYLDRYNALIQQPAFNKGRAWALYRELLPIMLMDPEMLTLRQLDQIRRLTELEKQS